MRLLPLRLLPALAVAVAFLGAPRDSVGCTFWEGVCTVCPSSLFNGCSSFAGQERACGFLGCEALCNSAAGTLCGSEPTTCSNQDTCNGSGTCLPNHRPAGSACGSPADTDCTNPDTCNGSGTCLTNHAAAGTVCGPPPGACRGPGTCNSSGVCNQAVSPAGTSCGDPRQTPCSAPDSCDGSGNCHPRHASFGTYCDDDGDGNECTGACLDGDCLSVAPKPPGYPCGDPSDTDCTDPDACDGEKHCVPRNASRGTPCATGTCDDTGQCLTPVPSFPYCALDPPALEVARE
jgi:hypothetical protein